MGRASLGEPFLFKTKAPRPRSDMHALFDRGYLGVTPDYRLRVSPRLRDEFGNGLDLYAQERAGEVIHLPSARDEWPRSEQLEWHLAEVFKSA